MHNHHLCFYLLLAVGRIFPRLIYRLKRLAAVTPRFEVKESSTVAAARQLGLDVTHAIDYGFVDTVDATPERPMTREVGYGITDVWDDMVGDIGMAVTFEREAMYARRAWAGPEYSSSAIESYTLEAREPARTDDPEDVDSSS
ncbi:hypothetical protein Tco_0217048 [Tanacetum coccineum]